MKIIKKGKKLPKYYLDSVKNKCITLPFVPDYADPVWHLFVIRNSERVRLQEYLGLKGVQTMIHYPIPPHRQGAYREMNTFSFPISEKIHKDILSLPMSSILNDKDKIKIIEVTEEYK